MPLSQIQKRVLHLLAVNRSPESYLAGGAAIHRPENSPRYSQDLDIFNDSESVVAQAFAADRAVLEKAGYSVAGIQALPGYVRADVSDGTSVLKLDWARDSAFRFMPLIKDPEIGYLLHPVDLAINKVLALAGRDEIRDLIDTLYVHETTLGLGALCWAAAGKDPGFSPPSLLEMLRSKGRVTDAELMTLSLPVAPSPVEIKSRWINALTLAAQFVSAMPPKEVGCLYYHAGQRRFIQPEPLSPEFGDCERHCGSPGGVIPQLTSRSFLFMNEEEKRRLKEAMSERPGHPGFI